MSDLISRQAAIEALKVAYWDDNIQSAKDDPCIVDAMTDWAIRQVKALPSAQSTQKNCSNSLDALDCVSRESAIKEIENEFAKVLTSHGYDSYEKADIFFQWYCDGLMKAIGILLDVDAEQAHWIPCSERMPDEEKKTYWICTDTGCQGECRWTNNVYGLGESDRWEWSILDIPRYSKVVAWMPLPEPYEERREVNETD